MSIKIWCAYKCPLADVEAAIKCIGDQLREKTARRVHRYALLIKKEDLLKSAGNWENNSEYLEALRDSYLISSFKRCKGVNFSLCDCGFTAYIYQGNVYFIIDGHTLALDEDRPDWLPSLVDFHYQDSADPPSEVDYQEYEARKGVWTQVLGWDTLDNGYSTGLRHDVFSINEESTWFHINSIHNKLYPFDLEQQGVLKGNV